MRPVPSIRNPHSVQELSDNDVLTTGEVARLCHVAPRTVSKWVDSGRLRGYRIPGSRDRRIPAGHLAAFMRAHGIPTDGVAGGLCRVLIVAAEIPGGLAESLAGANRYEVRTASTAFAAGVSAQQFRPQVVVLDGDEGSALELCRQMRSVPELQGLRVIAVASPADGASRRPWPAGLLDRRLMKPWSVWQVARAIEEVTSLVP